MESLRARLEREDDPETIRQFVEDAKVDDHRAGSVAFLRALYGRRKSRALYAALRELCTLPELEALPPPEGRKAGRYGEVILERESYVRLLAGMAAYPFSSHTARWVILLGGPVFAGAMAVLSMPVGLFLTFPALVFGYFLAYGFTVVRESLEGRLAAPGWPDAGEILEYLACFLRWWMSATVSFLPALVVLSFWTSSIESAETASALSHPAVYVAGALALLGLLYYPMGLLMAAALESAFAPLNVARGVKTLARLGLDYGRAWLAFMLLSLAGTAVQWAVGAVAAESSWPLRLAVQVPVSWILLYLFVLQMRALGLLFFARRDDIAWFR